MVARRAALSSLMLYDLRSVLAELEGGPPISDVRERGARRLTRCRIRPCPSWTASRREGEAEGADRARGRARRGRGSDSPPDAARPRAAGAALRRDRLRARCSSRTRVDTTRRSRSPRAWSGSWTATSREPGRARAGRARARAARWPTAATSPSSTPRTGRASRSRSTTAASSARERPRARASACAWCRASRPTSATWTASRRPTCCGLRIGRPGACGAPARASRRPWPPPSAPGVHPVALPPDDVPAERKAELLRACDERARAAGAEVAQVQGRATPRTGGAWRSTTPTARGRRTTARACVSASRSWPAATIASRPGRDTRGGHAGFELLESDPEEVAERAARKALTLLDAVDAPTGRLPVVVGQRLRRRAAARGGGPRPRGGRDPEGRERVRRQARRAARRAVRDRLRRRRSGPASGAATGSTTRARPRAAPRSSRTGDSPPTSTTCCGPRTDGVGLDRQRPARVVPAPADPAHDQHLLRARRGHRRRS